ncbi:MAG: electron transport complex subunit RsxA [Clostridiales bacterium]|nr:electron transport complex subunit RsxA [Clostridiales bacterium]
MSDIIKIVIGGILVNNYIMSQFLGICPFLGVSKKSGTAFGMGMAVTFVMTIASFFTWMIEHFILIPLKIEFMQTIAFILVIASLVQIVELVLKKLSRALYQALGVYLPLITTNCAVLGVAILNSTSGYSLFQSVLNGFSSALGFTLSIVLFAFIRERLAANNMPKWMDGFPGALIAAGLMSLAFLGFSGLI